MAILAAKMFLQTTGWFWMIKLIVFFSIYIIAVIVLAKLVEFIQIKTWICIIVGYFLGDFMSTVWDKIK